MRHHSSLEHARPATAHLPIGRHLVLVVNGRHGGPGRPWAWHRSQHRVDHLIEVDPREVALGDVRSGAKSTALRSWCRIGAEFSHACLGIVAEAGAATATVGDILMTGLSEGTLPGAVALLGYQADFVETCLLISSGAMLGRPGRSAGAVPRRGFDCPVSEYPAIVMFLSASDPSLLECASACRSLRSVGFDARLEIVDGGSLSGHDLRVDTLDSNSIAELDAFFGTNLEPCFPNLFQDAS